MQTDPGGLYENVNRIFSDPSNIGNQNDFIWYRLDNRFLKNQNDNFLLVNKNLGFIYVYRVNGIATLLADQAHYKIWALDDLF